MNEKIQRSRKGEDMLKKLVLIVVVLAALLVTASPAMAQSYAGTYYVNTANTTNGTGTQASPFNTLDAAITAAQNNPYGGYIYTWNATTNAWVYYGYISTVVPPDTGMPLSTPALFALLGIVAVGMVAGGWFLMRRSRTLAHPA
jgi:hypothetical protein